MKLLTSLLAALTLLVAPPATAQEPPVARPALWKVSDADTTIYLFGTIHALPPDVEWYRGRVAQAFEGSQELVTEIVETEPTQMQQIVLARAILPQGKSLRDMIAADKRKPYEAALASFGLPAGAFDRFKPWYAAVALATLPLAKEGFAADNGVEQALDARAKALGHPHTALETADYQLGLFDSLPAEVQRRYLGEVLDQLPEVKDQLLQIVAAWQAGDAERLARLINDDEDEPEMLETLLIGRNRNWADWIKARLDKPGTVFVAVGAGHLAGSGSVQDQLKTRGVAATRVQ